MRLNLITAPSSEPITIAQVEGQCRLDSGMINDLGETATVNLFISAIRQRAEAVTRRALINQTWELVLDGFPVGRNPIEIPRPPLVSVESVKYIDISGQLQTLDPSLYRAESNNSPTCQPAQLLPAYGQVWPLALDDVGVVRIRFTCGYGEAENVPASILQWMLLNIASLYENRESQTVASGRLMEVDLSTLADGLLADYRVYGW